MAAKRMYSSDEPYSVGEIFGMFLRNLVPLCADLHANFAEIVPGTSHSLAYKIHKTRSSANAKEDSAAVAEIL